MSGADDERGERDVEDVRETLTGESPEISKNMITDTVTFTVNGTIVTVPAEGTLLTALREKLRSTIATTSVKDGCAPQGQCGCCTVWVDGEPRVSCVTPVARVKGRKVTTLEGLDADVRAAWSEALCATGGSQCGFCTPGIIMRLAAKVRREHFRAQDEMGMVAPGAPDAKSFPGATSSRDTPGSSSDRDDIDVVDNALLAHLCRCTGWQTIHEAAVMVRTGQISSHDDTHRDLRRAAERATLEGHAPQVVGLHVALGEGGFADDHAPTLALVAVVAPNTGRIAEQISDVTWVLGDDPAAARKAAGVVPGRKSTIPVSWPIDVPANYQSSVAKPFVRTLRTTWVEPGYLEPDAVWCVPGGEPVGPLTNGGAFGGKVARGTDTEDLGTVARRLADGHGRPVRILLSREDVVRLGPKRPPMALAVRADGSGELWAAKTPGLRQLVDRIAPDWVVHEVSISAEGRSSLGMRAAGWAEIAIMRSAVRDISGRVDRHPRSISMDREYTDYVLAPNGAQAWAGVTDDSVTVRVQCGPVLDDVVLRSYCIGAAHMALGWVRSEGIAVDEFGVPLDLTIRSLGILRAIDMPHVHVEIVPSPRGEPINGSDAVFAAVAAAAWRHAGFPPAWPCSTTV